MQETSPPKVPAVARAAGSSPALPARSVPVPAADGAPALRLEAHASFEAARADWTRFQAAADGHPFQHHDWLAAWHAAIGRGRGVEPFIVVAKDADGAVRAVYPLGIRAAGPARLLVPLGEGVCDYHAPLVDGPFFARAPAAARARLWEAITRMAPADAALVERLLPDAHGNPYGASVLRPHWAATHVLRLGDDWERFFAERRGTKTRRTLREKRNRLARLGPVRFGLAESPAERARLLALAVALKARQLAPAGYRNPYRHEDVCAFYRSLAGLAPEQSALRVFALDAGGATAAVAVCMLRAGRLYYLLPAYDRERFRRCSPGLLLLCEMMRWSIEHGLTLFDFTIGDESYKDEWCDETLPLAWSVDAWTPRGRVAAAALAGSLTVKRVVATDPRLRPVAVRALDWLWAVRRPAEPAAPAAPRMALVRPAADAARARPAELAVEVVEQPGPAWDEMTAGFADAAYEQSVAYTAGRWGARRLVGLVLRDEHRRAVAAALAVTVDLPLVGAGFAHVKFGPLWRPRDGEPAPGVLAQALAALRHELGERRGLLVRVMPPVDAGFEPVWRQALADAGFAPSGTLAHPHRYLVDLTLSDAEQLASFGNRWRAQLRKAARDLRCDELVGEGALAEFQGLFQAMVRRKRFADRHGLEVLPALLAHPVAAHRTRIFAAWHGATPVAVSVVGGAGDTRHALFGATADDALPLRAGYALRWWVLRRLRDGGARWLDLGGDEGDAGLRHFKKGCVGKRGRIVALPGEFDWCDRRLSRLTAQAVGVARDALVGRDAGRPR